MTYLIRRNCAWGNKHKCAWHTTTRKQGETVSPQTIGRCCKYHIVFTLWYIDKIKIDKGADETVI